MAGVVARRATAALAVAALVVASLTACFLIPSFPSGESSNGMTNSLDTDAIAEAVTATSASIETTTVDTRVDGLTTLLYVRPVITTAGLTADELDALLRVAYQQSLGEVATIEVRTVDASDEPVDVKAAATELGIHYLPHTNSVTYSTTTLDTEYGQ